MSDDEIRLKFWSDVFLSSLDQGGLPSECANRADQSLALYDKRFDRTTTPKVVGTTDSGEAIVA